ncbi:hypothetical protein COU86_01800 [Candidatus Roizmanbacteria bacterium CG10_big_fil_rev_8_21_14_0_10_36_26]|uniref:Uncharacterized protein n=1 Tax=Candidatus Roizmanbacteria bacterium CG10_big_fil_rev_8_21_14_0_10_36_26 TaxID=1974851 RepID=A0A2M8KLL5_9BACT|nr:MAG: hypothetical protein CO166_00300 [Candidatus Roizmanbacteria bacterium CG_4_9_14_3_um_filter_36_11]PJE60817.1 MAG: hypothetical protein COU86_01800 [Candidatus Roizmanbacteria bacterium CG10_big_fil_rev_8_21_14_0_10_36_26]
MTRSAVGGALPRNGFLLFTGWRFTKNVELHLISSAFGLACSSAAPPPAFAKASAGRPPATPEFIPLDGEAIFCARDFLALRASKERIYSFPCPSRPCAENIPAP